jgi:hypothetical protein
MSKDPFNPARFGLSALGNNSVESAGKGSSQTPVSDTTPRGVPLVFDKITGTWCAELSRINQEDREVSLEVARLTNEDQSFLSRAGFIQK